MWEEIAETFDGFTKEEFFVALKNIKARYENNIVRKDIKGGEIKRCYFMDLPECIIFDILVKVPPIYIYKNGRLVCRLWREIISRGDFISQNFIQTKAELLIGGPTSHSNNQYGQVKLMEMEGMQLDFKLLDFGLRRMGDVRSSCNGLLLVNHPKQKGVIQVMNLVTLAGSTLPSCPSGCPHKACGLALGYDSIKKEYKVVHIYADAFGFEIISLGCPGAIWKRISGPWRDLQERPFNFEVFSWNDPISVNGEVLHWYVASEKYIVSMDVREETCIKTYLPNIDEEIKRDRYTLVELGGYLSFVYICSDIQVDIWILDDFRGQLWSKKHSIKVELTNYMADKKSLPSTDCNSALPNFSKLVTVASTQDGEILILKHANSCLYMYHIRHRLMKKLRMNMKHPRRFIPHRSSLLHWRTMDDS